MFNIYSGLAFLALITCLILLIRLDRKSGRKSRPMRLLNAGPVSSEDQTACTDADRPD
ncbi:hypothetical protein CLV41_111153 [Roseibium marinum]|uniref:Uncharacterized protein n=1 Tax=Roseibium marinum TaxID=281252 RepID=A0A2S3UMF0_9HYPH|nr:hypothetical protein CLV41_111153 [Roseibium marinum]